MKKCNCFTVLLTLALLNIYGINYSQVLNSNWQWLHPKPQGNTLTWCKMWDANNWYIAGFNGTFMKTTNGGINWIINGNAGRTLDNTGQRCNIRSAHFFNQNAGILVGDIGSVTKTTDGGDTFDTIASLFNENYNWNCIFFNNNSTGYVAGGAGNSGILAKTTDGGASWQYVSTSVPSTCYDIHVINDTVILYSSLSGLIGRSSDGGVNWSLINTTFNELYKFCFLSTDTGFVCGSNGKVLSTLNGGLNWNNADNGLPVSTFRDMDYRRIGNNTEIYLTGNPYYIYKTTDLGISWDTIGILGDNQIYTGADHFYYCSDIGINDTILTVGGYGLINKRNSAASRILYTDFVKFGNSRMFDLWIEGNKIWAIGEPTTPGVTFDQLIYSSNGGVSWISQNTGNISESFSCIQMLNSNTGYITGISGMIMKTINGGFSWTPLTSPTSTLLQKVKFVNENTGWVFGGLYLGSPVIYKTTDGAASWSQQSANLNGGIYSAQMLDENTGWVVGVGILVNKTTNGGLNWIPYSHNIQTAGVGIDIKMVDANTGYICGNKLIAKTTNGGINWAALPIPYPANSQYQFTSVDFINSEVGMLLEVHSTLKTTNGGSSWVIENLGTMAGSFFTAFSRLKMVSEDTVYAGGSYSSVLKYSPQSPIGITEWQTGVPKEFMLYQNYPNPFNPSTTIKFAIPKQGKVTLKVYDIIGREVSVILNDLELNPGTVKHTFNGSELSSGVYFYSLFVDNSLIETRKMVLIK